jgi:hypothetical protein
VILVLQVVMHNDGDFMVVILPYMAEKYFSTHLSDVDSIALKARSVHGTAALCCCQLKN